MKALITGGTGTLGRLVVPRLRDAGGDIRVLSRHRPEVTEGIEYVTGDLATGEGIDAAVAGTEIIVHCAGSAKGDEDKARHLVRAASRSGTRHLVNISVVGADRIPVAGRLDRAMFSYFMELGGTQRRPWEPRASNQGRGGPPSWREPRPGTGCWPPNMGRLPR